MTLSERQLEAMWRWVREAAHRYADDLIPGEGSPMEHASLHVLAVESEETPAPRKECKPGNCVQCCGDSPYPSKYCSCPCHLREASAPATRSATYDRLRREEGVEKILDNVILCMGSDCYGDEFVGWKASLEAAVRLYREERAAKEWSSRAYKNQLADSERYISTLKRERDTAVRERDEARERIEKALALHSVYGAHQSVRTCRCTSCETWRVLRGDEKK